MRLTDEQIEWALDHYSDTLYPLNEQLGVHEDPKTGKRTPIPFFMLVRECEDRKWWTEQSIRLLRSFVDFFDGKRFCDPHELVKAAKEMFGEQS